MTEQASVALVLGTGLQCSCGETFTGDDIEALLDQLMEDEDGEGYPGGWPVCCGREVAGVVMTRRFVVVEGEPAAE